MGEPTVGTRHYTIPLRAAWNVPRTKRAARAVSEVRIFVNRHMNVQEDEKVHIDSPVNEFIWSRGIQKPPRRIHVEVTRHEDFEYIEVKLDEGKYAGN